MKIILFILLNLILNGCAIHKPNFYGSYEYKGVYGVYHRIELFSNSTFTYEWRGGLNSGVSSGTYKMHEGYLILTGDKKPEPKIIVEEKNDGNQDSIYIEVLDIERTPLGLAAVKINNQTTTFTDIDGKTVCFKTENIDQIKVSYLALKSEYKSKNPNSNSFVFRINDSIDKNVYFNNVKVVLLRNKIFFNQDIGFISKKIILKRSN